MVGHDLSRGTAQFAKTAPRPGAPTDDPAPGRAADPIEEGVGTAA
ncbi:unannotated protein [freshwater metagenome]|uniref:Unannotated protein n=1 Tax=freshwater metagenome TaxID=449393 RepID=A0A6J6NVE1_9ZZZZ